MGGVRDRERYGKGEGETCMWRSVDNLQELILFSTMWVLGLELMSSGLSWQVPLPIEPLFEKQKQRATHACKLKKNFFEV